MTEQNKIDLAELSHSLIHQISVLLESGDIEACKPLLQEADVALHDLVSERQHTDKFKLSTLKTDSRLSRIYKKGPSGEDNDWLPLGYLYHKTNCVTGSFSIDDMPQLYELFNQAKNR